MLSSIAWKVSFFLQFTQFFFLLLLELINCVEFENDQLASQIPSMEKKASETKSNSTNPPKKDEKKKERIVWLIY
jgi:hypothetical protein